MAASTVQIIARSLIPALAVHKLKLDSHLVQTVLSALMVVNLGFRGTDRIPHMR